MARIFIIIVAVLTLILSALLTTDAAVSATPGENYGTIIGKVVDKTSDEPIERAVVRIEGSKIFFGLTRESGNFIIRYVPPGFHALACEKRGYHPTVAESIGVEAGDTARIEFVLSPERPPQVPTKTTNKFGTIMGRVTDRLSGEVVTGAPITVTGTPGCAITDRHGEYEIHGVPPFPVSVSVEMANASPFIVDSVFVQAGDTAVVDLAIVGRAKDWKCYPQFDSGFVQGVAEADLEILEKRATIYSSGLGGGFHRIDWNTGLLNVSIAGCIVTPFTSGRQTGHNKRILEYIESNDIPDYSYKHWEELLHDLPRYYHMQMEEETPCPLPVNGPENESLDGLYQLRLIRSKWVEIVRNCIMIIEDNRARRVCSPDFSNKNVEFVWAPEGSNMAILRWANSLGFDGDNTADCTYAAVDLRRGLIVQKTTASRSKN